MQLGLEQGEARGSRRWGGAIRALLWLVLALLPGANAAAESLPAVALPPEALDPSRLPSLATRPAPSKVDGVLLAPGGAAAASAALPAGVSVLDGQGRLQVEVVTSGAAPGGLEAAVEAVGGIVTGRSAGGSVLQAWVGRSALEGLAARSDVVQVRAPKRAYPATLTEALPVMNGTAWQGAGLRGAGMKVGIIDVGFLHHTQHHGTELPGAASIFWRNFVDGQTDAEVDGGSTHGTSMAELIHDLAPDAEIYLAKILTSTDFDEAVDWMLYTAHVDVINTSLLFFNDGPGDGTGPLVAKTQEARDRGVVWVTAAGNNRPNHWSGPHQEVYPVGNGRGFVKFPNGTYINHFGPGPGVGTLIAAGELLVAYLRWSDWSEASQDLNFGFVRWNAADQFWSYVGYDSNRPQQGLPGQEPTEMAYVWTEGEPAFYGYMIVGPAPAPTPAMNLDVFAPGPYQSSAWTPERSLGALADAPATIAVGAIDVSTFAQDPFSSEGPTNGPGGLATGGSLKPDLAAYAEVSTESSVPYLFGRTSAAAAHVSGAAALLRGFYRTLPPRDIGEVLRLRAADLGVQGPDTAFGAGRLDLGPWPPDLDGDGVPDDGDGSLVAGDSWCSAGGVGCDDICVLHANASQADADGDGAGDACDDCTQRANGPKVGDAGAASQRDTDDDGYGNICDPDFNQDVIVNFADLAYLKARFFTTDASADLNGDGFVNFGDLALLKVRFFKAPGPSGVAP